MKFNCYEINQDRFLEPSQTDKLSAKWLTDDVERWVNIEKASEEELKGLLSPLKLHPLVIEGCLSPGFGPRVAAYEKAIFINYPIVPPDNNDHRPAYLSFICLPTTLITIHEEPQANISELIEDLTGERRLLNTSITALLYAILSHLADQNLKIWLESRSKIDQLTDQLEKDPASVDTGDILSLKRTLNQLMARIGELFYCISAIRRVDSKALQIEDYKVYFGDMAASIDNSIRLLENMEKRVRDLHQFYESTQQELTNRRLKVLTILSAVFLPATLIAGIFGMNFKFIPLLELRYGYFVGIGFMVSIVLGMLIYFKKTGWFD